MKFHHITWCSFAAAPYVMHPLRVASSARSFSIVPWTLFWLNSLPTVNLWSTHLQKLSNIYLQKCSENLKGLDKTIPKIYICWGIVGDTNLTNFHQFSVQFHQFHGILSTGLTRQFLIYIYILGSNPDFSFAHLNRAKLCVCGGYPQGDI